MTTPNPPRRGGQRKQSSNPFRLPADHPQRPARIKSVVAALGPKVASQLAESAGVDLTGKPLRGA